LEYEREIFTFVINLCSKPYDDDDDDDDDDDIRK